MPPCPHWWEKGPHLSPLVAELSALLPVICWEELGQAVVRNHLLEKLGLSRPLLIPQPTGAKGVN